MSRRLEANGHRGNGAGKSPTYKSWATMRDRCTNPNAAYWHRYGGRGITCCERWSKFAAFLADMGERPPGLTLERRDSNGNYEPANCTWATRSVQAANRAEPWPEMERAKDGKFLRKKGT